MENLDWKKIKDNQTEKQFYFEGKPVFKQFVSILKFHEPGLAPVQDESGWYHIKTDGNPLYQERFKRTFGFYCSRAAVTESCGKCFHLDTNGNRVYSENYDWCGNFQENICTVRKFDSVLNKNFYFHIDLNGNRLYSKNYSYAGDFRDGIAVVRNFDGLCRHINSKGEFINEKAFLDLGVFHKNIAPARDEKGWFHSDILGNELYERRFSMIEPFYNGFALVQNFDGTKEVISEKGETVVCL